MWHNVWLVAVGVIIGAVGTLVGAGGGFLLVPYLILVERLRTHVAVSISMAVVFWNALSGTAEYLRQKRTDIRSGLLFTASALPGALIGTAVSPLLSGELFRIIFSLLLLLVTYRLLGGKMYPDRNKAQVGSLQPSIRTIQTADSIESGVIDTAAVYAFTRSIEDIGQKAERKRVTRFVTDLFGHSYAYSFRPSVGIILSFFVGIYSGLFGVGGGILHVPIMVGILDFPIHIATATSHFVLVFTSFASSVENVLMGSFYAWYVFYLSVGVAVGAQIGARIANRVSERRLKVVLGFLLIITSAKMILG